MTSTILGLDIGGANLKAATPDRRAVSLPFALWQQPDMLPAALAQLVAQFPEAEELAVTMTGELCDCFETKCDGVNAIVAAVCNVSRGRRIRVWSTDGVFLNPDEARRHYPRVAGANWHALATLVGRYVPEGPSTLIDMGSTTTDVIPILDGQPVARGRTDEVRLRYQELVYTGIRRTPVVALMTNDAANLWRVAAEIFATTLDVYLWLGMIGEDGNDTNTADHRPATRRNALARLARMFCADIGEIREERIDEFASFIARQQASLIAGAFDRVFVAIDERLREQLCDPDRAPRRIPILCGSGEFLLRQLFTSTVTYTAEPISLSREWGDAVAACGPAYAVAVLAAECPET